MRVIAGSARGRQLVAPRDRLTRPISDRVKEALFGSLGARIVDARVLDLYAGSGAIGIEALSRGAARATFVEHARPAVAAIRDNLERTGFTDRADVNVADVATFLATTRDPAWDVAILDPPYAERTLDLPLERLGPHLAPGALVVVKHFWRTSIPAGLGFVPTRTRRFGETALTFLEEARDMRVAVFPGSFDPITRAHLDVVRRGAELFDRLVIGVLGNPRKTPLFSVEERVALIVAEVGDLSSVRVESFDGLTVEFAARHQAGFVIRGLRAISDFEAELQMAHTNRRLAPGIDTVFLMTGLEFGYVSSSLAKEVAAFGGDVSPMVPPGVEKALRNRSV